MCKKPTQVINSQEVCFCMFVLAETKPYIQKRISNWPSLNLIQETKWFKVLRYESRYSNFSLSLMNDFNACAESRWMRKLTFTKVDVFHKLHFTRAV